MNANELADDMESGMFNDANYNKKKAAEFIRQQQAEIEALKAKTLTDEEILNIAHQIRLIDRQTADDGHLYFARAVIKEVNGKC